MKAEITKQAILLDFSKKKDEYIAKSISKYLVDQLGYDHLIYEEGEYMSVGNDFKTIEEMKKDYKEAKKNC